MAKDFERMEDGNRRANPSIHEVSDPARRVFLLGGIGALTVGALAPWLAGCAAASVRGPRIGFKSVPVSDRDTVVVPEGYEAPAFAAWGEPVGVPGNMPEFRWDASNSAADQAVQMGMHHDGIHYYPLDGRTMLGTLNNCASGLTPWGTYLSAEENWAFYFDGPDTRDADQRRWGLLRTGLSRWGEHDPRFDAKRHPNEFHRFGWVVEIDPYDPASVPVKRTALGRGAHEGARIPERPIAPGPGRFVQ